LTAAIMPQPHEQKLQEVVNSLTSASFKSLVAARMAGTSSSPPTASPAPPPNVSLNRSLRLRVGLGAFGDSSMGSSVSRVSKTKQTGKRSQRMLSRVMQFRVHFGPGLFMENQEDSRIFRIEASIGVAAN
jgi:hypothetical protein